MFRLSACLAGITLLLAGLPVLAEGKPVIYTVNYPLQYFAERIAAGHAEVILPVPAGVDPAFWQPDAATVLAYQQADLVLLNGAGYAKWLSRVSLPRRKQVDTSAAFRDRYLQVAQGVTHSHGREGDHSHSGVAFTTWLDFSLAAEQARAIATALVQLRPEQAALFEANLEKLQQDLLALDRQMKELVSADPRKALLASHPVYQYMKHRYGMNLVSVMWEPDVLPDASAWAQLQSLARQHPAQWMLWEHEPMGETAARLGTLGVSSLVFNPCGNRPDDGDFLGVMQRNIHNLEQAF